MMWALNTVSEDRRVYLHGEFDLIYTRSKPCHPAFTSLDPEILVKMLVLILPGKVDQIPLPKIRRHLIAAALFITDTIHLSHSLALEK